jgi:intracellular multiplication protein IcmL
MSDKVLETVKLRTDFYRDGYRKLATIVLILCASNLLSILTVSYMFSKPQEVRFFATSSDGRIIPVQPLNQPGITNAELLDWTVRAATKIYSYDYVNYRDDLQSVSAMFTGQGWQSFQDTLTSSRVLKTVVAEKLVMSATPTGSATIIEKGILNGKFTWKVQVPMLVKLQGNTPLSSPVLVTMLVQRVSLVNNPEGIGIINIVVKEG